MGSSRITVEVAYALPGQQEILSVRVPVGTSVFDAVPLSGLLEIFPEIDLDSADMGVFGKVVRQPKEQMVAEGDRIEIYRPLIIDPKQARLNRVAKK